MSTERPIRTIVLIWLAWAAILIAFQALVPRRIEPQGPDRVLSWTASETGRRSLLSKPYLRDPFLNGHVSWDSEFYLSIALHGYDDPNVRANSVGNERLSLNYAFFPFYPLVIRIVMWPLSFFGLSPIATATLAGVLVSLAGTLAGMLALYDIVRDELGEAGGVRAAFYLLIFPMGFFLAQVYTEGLFVGLAFTSLALMRKGHLGKAALLAVFATWTRAVGVALAVPLLWGWLQAVRAGWHGQRYPVIGVAVRGLAVAAPVGAYLLWRASPLGRAFQIVEDNFFSRGLFALRQSLRAWGDVLGTLPQANSQTQVYYAIELAIIALALIACFFTLRRYPELALFGLVVIAVSLTSGVPQSMGRYLLVVPSIYVFLGRLGRNEAFDRTWTLASVLLAGLLVSLFTFDWWVG